MTYNFNDVIDARGSLVGMLQRIYGQNNYLLWEKPTPDPSEYSSQYLTFQYKGGTQGWWQFTNHNDPDYPISIEYKKNDGEWISVTAGIPGAWQVYVTYGDTIQVRGNNRCYGYDGFDAGYAYHFTGSPTWTVYGNIMSLISSSNFASLKSFTTTQTFAGLFIGMNISNAENLILPATTLSTECYARMFQANPLVLPPVLPATIMAEHCYDSMFNSCSLLVNAPALPSTSLEWGCYMNMFSQCTRLTGAPILPATNLAAFCYYQMFWGCTSLVNAPDLNATTLVGNCYNQMFTNCTSLKNVKCLATDISADRCTTSWLQNVSSRGTFTKASNTEWPTGTNGIPSRWTVQNV